MNLTPTNVIVFAIGAILLYCAFKDKNPKDVVLQAFGQTANPTAPTSKPQTGVPQSMPAPAPRRPFITSV